jgi:hypothetical protein
VRIAACLLWSSTPFEAEVVQVDLAGRMLLPDCASQTWSKSATAIVDQMGQIAELAEDGHKRLPGLRMFLRRVEVAVAYEDFVERGLEGFL